MKTTMEKVTKEDQELARASVETLKKKSNQVLNSSRRYARIKFIESEGYIHVPKKALTILYEIVKEMSEGKSVNFISSDEELSTEDAAIILNVSRPFVVKLLEKNEIPYSKIGTHRRMLRSDIEAYQRKMKKSRKEQLNKLSGFDQQLGLE
ncbi:MAG: helix-turn-helix domain-containing protein [Chitinophagaceae bacterium]